MVSGNNINIGIRNGFEQTVNLFQIPDKRLTVKQIPCDKQQIHRILADPRNYPAECFPYLLFPPAAPCASSVRNCPQVNISKMNTSQKCFLLYQRSQFFTVRGNGITSRIFPIPVRYMIMRSKPSPKPACLVVPYFLRSR